jgi:hypothetical protein
MEREEEKQIQEYLCRPGRYANIDGVTEMTAAFTCFGLALFGWIPSVTPKGSLWHQYHGVALLAMFVVWQGLVILGSKEFKKRVTYPRTGFVSYPPAQKRRPALVAFVVAMATSAALAFLAARHHLRLEVFFGLGITLFYAVIARPYRTWKLAILTVMFAGGTWMGMLPGWLDRHAPAGLSFYAVLYLAAGLITLALYLRHSQPGAPVAE